MTKKKRGHVLTVKQLTKRHYAVIHSLPVGHRRMALVALLEAAAELAERHPDWFREELVLDYR